MRSTLYCRFAGAFLLEIAWAPELLADARPRADLNRAGCVPELAGCDGAGLLLILEAREVGAFAPRKRSAQTLARAYRGVVDDVDQPLVVRRALRVARKVAEVARGREERRHAGNLGDLGGVLHAFEGLDHQDQDKVVVDRLAVSAWHAAIHVGRKRIAAAVAAPAERREERPVARRDGLLDGIDRGHHHDQRAVVE